MTGTADDAQRRGERRTVVTLDQVISSATNFFVVLVASRLFGASDFGAFAISLSAFGIALGVARTTSSERLVLERARGVQREALLPISLLVVLLAAELVIAAVWLLTSSAGATIWLVAAPVILIQDRLRYVSLSRRPFLALASDAVWLVASIAGWAAARLDALDVLSAMRVVLQLGPAIGLMVLVLGLRPDLDRWVSRDVTETVAESRFVLDSWILSSAVFVALSGVAALASLQVAGQVRLLFLVFQPFFSLAYVGRWLVLRARPEAQLGHWPIIATVGAAVYGVMTLGALELFKRLDLLPTVWTIGTGALVLNLIGQVARAYHQGVADLLRRTLQPGLIRSRTVFAFVLMVTAPMFARPWGLTGAALALAMSFGAGALVMARSVSVSRSAVG